MPIQFSGLHRHGVLPADPTGHPLPPEGNILPHLSTPRSHIGFPYNDVGQGSHLLRDLPRLQDTISRALIAGSLRITPFYSACGYILNIMDEKKQQQTPEPAPKVRKEIPLISVPNDRDMIAAEMAELFDEDRVSHQHGSSEPEAD